MRCLTAQLLLSCLAAIVVAGCGTVAKRAPDTASRPGGYYLDDGPGANPPENLDAIADAAPRVEPLNRFANNPYVAFGQRYVPLRELGAYRERGVASWYGRRYHSQRTSSGEIYDMYAMTAAHKTLPLPCYVRVTNLSNGRSVVVKVNDRGPFVANRIIDLSYVAAAKLGMIGTGTALVDVRAITPDSPAELTRVTESPPPALYVQVGAFAVRRNADHVLARLHAAGLAGAFVFGPPATRSHLYRVRIGPVSGVPEFDRLVARLTALGYPGARLVTP